MFDADCREALRLISDAKAILGVTHIAPDGDAIGSLLGLGLLLRRLGKSKVALACDDGVPEKYRFLPGAADVVRSTRGRFDLILALDCSDERRCGRVFRAASTGRAPVINIDHHVTNTGYGEVNIVLPDTVATTESLFRLMRAWGLELDPDLASCLLTGLVTDTLCLRTANVTPEVMRVAAELMKGGADLSDITARTVNRRRYDSIRFWGALLETVQLDDRVVSVHSSAASRRGSGYPANGDASVVSLLITAQEADMAASFVETDEGKVEVSFRAKPGFDVSGIALDLGGGGHRVASGCTVEGPLEPTRNRVMEMVKRARREQLARQ